LSGSIILGIAGGSGSGKTTLAKRVSRAIGSDYCSILSQDNYYIDQSARFDRDGGAVNFDHPSSLDFDLLAKHLSDLKKGKSIEVPRYDFKTHTRLRETEILLPKKVIILDGILILYPENVRKLIDIKVFVEIPEEVRFQRRLKRDIEERGRTKEGVTEQFFNQVKPMHDLFVEPSKKYADYIAHDDFDVDAFLEKENLLTKKPSTSNSSSSFMFL